MAAVTSYGARIMTGLVNVPATLAAPGLGGGVVRRWTEHVAPVAADSVGTTYAMARLPSSARIHGSSYVKHTAISTATATLNFGVYNLPGRSDGFTDSATGLNSGVVLSTAGTKDLIGTTTLSAKRLWEFTTTTVDPKCDMEIRVALASTDLATPSGGFIQMVVDYSFD